MGTYAFGVFLMDCYLQQNIEFSNGYLVCGIKEPLGARGEVDYILNVGGPLLGLNISGDSAERFMQASKSNRPTAFLSIPHFDAPSVEEGWRTLQPRLEITYDTLSFYTINAVNPFAYIVRGDGKLEIVILTSSASPMMIPFGTGMLARAQQIERRALKDPSYAVLLRLFRIANQTSNTELRVFHFAQFFDVMSEQITPNRDSAAIKCRNNLKQLGIYGQFQSITTKMGIAMVPPLDAIDALFDIRHRIAHDGHVVANKRVRPCAVPFVDQLDRFSIEVMFMAQFALEKLAGVHDL